MKRSIVEMHAAVNHHRAMRLAILADVFEIEAFRAA